ncbi:SemiSWEET family sugar transporter [Geotalea uraniireducens]|nr:SemiSWEET family transporter [Geotalea uraniireducens]
MLKRGSIDRTTRGVVLLSVIMLCGCKEFAVHDTSSLLIPRFQRSEVLGFVAGFGTTFAAMPDLIKMIKRRSSKGINPTMAGIMGVFQIVWIYYGLLIASRPVIVWNLAAVVINSMTVWAYFRFARIERNQAKE